VPVITGKANILAAYKNLVADKNFSLTWPPSYAVVVSKSGDMAYTEGSYTFTYTDPKTRKPVVEKGKYVEVYAKQPDGSWKDVVDTGIPDGPAAPLKTK
jgi:ketosteroid isomerase-like protein